MSTFRNSFLFHIICTFRKWAVVACSGPEGDDVFDNAIGCAFRNWTLDANCKLWEFFL